MSDLSDPFNNRMSDTRSAQQKWATYKKVEGHLTVRTSCVVNLFISEKTFDANGAICREVIKGAEELKDRRFVERVATRYLDMRRNREAHISIQRS